MNLKIGIVICLLFQFFTSTTKAQDVWMLGPMLHINFGGEKTKLSYALEASYWNYQNFPYSFDFAVEFEKGKFRVYSEGQTGIGFAGISAGPVLEYRKSDKKFKLGFQGSVWANYFWGFDFRIRKIGGENFISPGTYLKIPVTKVKSDGEEESNSGWDWDD